MTALCGCIPGHRMTVLESACLDCGFTEVEFFESGNRPCGPLLLDQHRPNESGPEADSRSAPGPENARREERLLNCLSPAAWGRNV